MSVPVRASTVSRRVDGSGAVDVPAATVATGIPPVAGGKVVTQVVPSRLTATMNVFPFGSVVRRGLFPVASNIPKAKVLPEVDVPFGELNAGPLNASWNMMLAPNVNPWK